LGSRAGRRIFSRLVAGYRSPLRVGGGTLLNRLESEKEGDLMKYTITATQTKVYEIEVEAADAGAAIDLLDEWNEDDFQDFVAEGGGWELEAI
jgi:hypothetical protein